MKTRTRKINPENPDFVTYSQPFAGIIRPNPSYKLGLGGKKIVLNSPQWYNHQLSKFKDNEKVTLIIHNRKPKRTEQQNRYLWGAYYPLIAEETGERNIDRLHELFKGLFLTKGIVKVLGKSVRMKGSTARLSKLEFGEFIMSIEAETGIKAPPTENYF